MSDEVTRVLLADDNLVNQKLATLLLQQLGLKVDVVETGQQAVQAAEKTIYSVILMDCQMPEMDGFTATKAIRKLEALRGTYTPIIAVTALAMVGDRERCISVGMDDYISKPIDRQMLKIKLNHWLKRDFVVHNQELARKYAQPETSTEFEEEPINIAELEDFYAGDLNDVLTTFVETTEKILLEIRKAINDRRDADLANMSHELKGASASVGAKGLAKLGLYLERAAGIRDWTEVKDTFAALEDSFSRVKKFLSVDRSHATAVLPGRD